MIRKTITLLFCLSLTHQFSDDTNTFVDLTEFNSPKMNTFINIKGVIDYYGGVIVNTNAYSSNVYFTTHKMNAGKPVAIKDWVLKMSSDCFTAESTVNHFICDRKGLLCSFSCNGDSYVFNPTSTIITATSEIPVLRSYRWAESQSIGHDQMATTWITDTPYFVVFSIDKEKMVSRINALEASDIVQQNPPMSGNFVAVDSLMHIEDSKWIIGTGDTSTPSQSSIPYYILVDITASSSSIGVSNGAFNKRTLSMRLFERNRGDMIFATISKIYGIYGSPGVIRFEAGTTSFYHDYDHIGTINSDFKSVAVYKDSDIAVYISNQKFSFFKLQGSYLIQVGILANPYNTLSLNFVYYSKSLNRMITGISSDKVGIIRLVNGLYQEDSCFATCSSCKYKLENIDCTECTSSYELIKVPSSLNEDSYFRCTYIQTDPAGIEDFYRWKGLVTPQLAPEVQIQLQEIITDPFIPPEIEDPLSVPDIEPESVDEPIPEQPSEAVGPNNPGENEVTKPGTSVLLLIIGGIALIALLVCVVACIAWGCSAYMNVVKSQDKAVNVHKVDNVTQRNNLDFAPQDRREADRLQIHSDNFQATPNAQSQVDRLPDPPKYGPKNPVSQKGVEMKTDFPNYAPDAPSQTNLQLNSGVGTNLDQPSLNRIYPSTQPQFNQQMFPNQGGRAFTPMPFPGAQGLMTGNQSLVPVLTPQQHVNFSPRPFSQQSFDTFGYNSGGMNNAQFTPNPPPLPYNPMAGGMMPAKF